MENTKKIKSGRQISALDILVSPEMSIFIPLLILCIYTSIVSPNFLKLKNIQVILRYTAYIGSLAVGEAFALMCGEIDLSVGTCSTMTSVLMGVLVLNYSTPLWLTIVITLLAGVAVGVVNSVLTLGCKINSWITTMSMQYICYGFATVMTKGAVIKFKETYLGNTLTDFANLRPLGLSWMFFIMLGLLLIGEVVIRFTPLGRKIHAVGLSVYAARVAGINVNGIKTLCFCICGFMSAVCGILQNIASNTGNNAVGKGNDFPAIICCVVGGVSNMGGKGSMIGCFIGILMYQTLKNCLQMLGANNNLQLVLVGIILIIAVYVDVLKVKLSQRVKKK